MKVMTQKRTKTFFSNRITQMGIGLLPFVAGLAIIPGAPLQVNANNVLQTNSFEQNRTAAQPILLANAERGELLKVASLNVKLMAAPIAGAQSLKINDHRTSYNDRLSGFAGVTSISGWRDGEKTRSGFDIVGFQEVWRYTPIGDTHYVKLRQKLENNGFQRKNILRGTGKGTERGWHHGLVIASKYPIVDSAEMKFHNSALGSADVLAEKGVLFARINVKGTTVAVFNTHLQAPFGIYPSGVRESQLRKIRRFMSKHARRGEPIVIMGDFNIQRSLKSCREGKTTEYCNWMGGGKAGGNWIDFRDTNILGDGVDYIITAGPGAATVTGQASQHWVYVDEKGRTGLSSTESSTPSRQQITDHPLVYGAFWVSH